MAKVHIGQKIRTLRKANGFTQEDLSYDAKIANSTLQRIELGEIDPKTTTIIAIAGAMGVPVGALFFDESGKGSMPAEALQSKGGRASLKQESKSIRNRNEAEMESASKGTFDSPISDDKRLFHALKGLSPASTLALAAFIETLAPAVNQNKKRS